MKGLIVAVTCLVALAAAAGGDDAVLTVSSAGPGVPTPTPLRSSTAADTMSSVDWTNAPPPTPTPATNMTSLDFLLDVFSVDRLEHVWDAQANLITAECHRDMAEFFAARRRAHIWALKMSDASGKYGGGYFFGNSYWLGSQTMCSNLAHNTSAHRKDMGHLSPPFTSAFYVVRADLQLPESVAEVQRTVNLGLCLPASCGARDVGRLVDLSVETANEMDPRAAALRQFKVTSVRMPASEYVFWEDPTFWVLIGVSFVVAVLLAAGTAYDLVLEHRKRTSLNGLNHSGYDNYSFGLGAPRLVGMRDKGDFGVRLDVTVPAVSTVGTAPAAAAPSHAPATESSLYSSSSELATSVYTGSAASSGDSCASRAPSSASSDTDPTNVWVELLLSFSLRRNIATIFDKSVGADTIPTLHGLKAISMAWVVLGHTCIVTFKYSDNMELRGLVEKELLFQTISNGAFSVDTFFMVSGLLVSFLYFRTTAKLDVTKITKTTGVRSNALEFVGLLIYRFLRLTSPYLFSLGIVQVTMKWFYHNSVFEPPTMDHINCPNYWWRNVLYINTLFPVKDMCMLWSWYLADDTQFYVLGIILLILATSHIRLSAATLFTFMVSSWCTTAYIAYSNQHMPSEDDPLALFDKIYDKPWTRLGPYLVGMAVGWILFKTDCKIRMSKVTVVLGWSLSFACLLSLLYGLYGAVLDPITAAAYSSLSHSAWAMSLSWIVIACSCGYGGPVNRILSWTLLYPFSRVTYCAYLVHPVVIRLLSMKMDAPLHLGAYTIFILFLGMLSASYLFAFVLSLAFEAPVVTMLRLISPKRKGMGRED
ncbi:O-acyltransferase like protein isoform X2 [Thrips palmi]|uniref:O-acyltransferase like protein isoform X2 n=1 Tax=Thrips palmi TaxID=161013 RepID=A0A6P8ZJ35_THRPL|nr:O-acyltransferase like protein isoform X2 [Thrips palmi]